MVQYLYALAKQYVVYKLWGIYTAYLWLVKSAGKKFASNCGAV